MRILIQTKFLVFIRNLDKWLKDIRIVNIHDIE